MAARKPIVYVSGFLMELPIGDEIAGAVQPNAQANPTVNTLQNGEFGLDSNTGNLVIRMNNLVWQFAPAAITSYNGQLDFSNSRNSHWIGSMI